MKVQRRKHHLIAAMATNRGRMQQLVEAYRRVLDGGVSATGVWTAAGLADIKTVATLVLKLNIDVTALWGGRRIIRTVRPAH